MSQVHYLLTLMRAEIDKLEKLRRLEAQLVLAPPTARPSIKEEIDATMEEIASLSRTVQNCKAASGIGETLQT